MCQNAWSLLGSSDISIGSLSHGKRRVTVVSALMLFPLLPEINHEAAFLGWLGAGDDA